MDQSENKTQEIQEEENDQKQKQMKEDKVIPVRKYIKKAKWKYVNLHPTIKQTHMFYLYGSILLFTDYTPENIFNSNTTELMSRYQQIQSVAINKQHNIIETNFNILNPGTLDFSFLVNLYEGKQDQMYYDFAQSLKDFKIFVDTLNKSIVEKSKTLKKLPKILEKLEQQYLTFETWSGEIVDKHFKDEFYSYTLFNVNYRKGYVEMKKHVSSQNMISLFGQTMTDVYEAELCRMKNKSIAFERHLDFDVNVFMENITYSLKCSSKQMPFASQRTRFRTIEGFEIPVTSENNYIKFFDYKKNDKDFLFFSDNDYVLFVNVIKVEDFWLKKLIDVREDLQAYQKPNNPQLIQPNRSQDKAQSFQIDKIRNELFTDENSIMQQESNNIESLNSSQKISVENSSGIMDIQDTEIISDNKIDQETCYFIPQMIDLVGNEFLTSVIKNQNDQEQKKEILADCMNKYYNQRQQALEISSIEYSCQVEYFIDKFYSQDNNSNENKQCQFRVI